MSKLTYSKPNNFQINNKRSFVAEPIEIELLDNALKFAYAMVYGNGHHRDHRSGGLTQRKKGEVFCNTFQGKLAEVILHRLFKTHDLKVDDVDFKVYGEGAWDDCDLTVNGKRINIKSAASFANLLLLEAQDWDENGNYLPNAFAGESAQYDYFVLVRFKPDIKSLFQANEMFHSNEVYDFERIKTLLNSVTWFYDIAGCMSNLTLKALIAGKYIVPQGSMLNGSIKMDANNYYIQAGDLKPFASLIEKLKT
ncbi:MAG: hypothetical protein EOO42_05270 [Flavobacteriales bacterium]|nr:MAG: hypothetical protein EOO42_05270 [Flavobacteriales bacterium]